jgi:hypothetical protein
MSEKLNGLLNKIISTDGIIISAIEDHSNKIAALSSSLNAVNEKNYYFRNMKYKGISFLF